MLAVVEQDQGVLIPELGDEGVGVGLAAFGFLNPLLAAFIHVSSEMAFILNSARLLPSVSSAGKIFHRVVSQSPSATA